MAGIKDYSTTPANNNSSPPNGAPENMNASDVNNVIRQVMADIRSFYETMEYKDWGDTLTYLSSTSFRIDNSDVTSRYQVNRRVKVYGVTTGTIYGTITSSSFSTHTTVNIEFDSGSMNDETLSVFLGVEAINPSIPFSALKSVGAFDFGKTTEKTIASGWVTVGQEVRYTIDTQNDDAADTLAGISGYSEGKVIILQPESGSRTITVKHLFSTGNINLSNDDDYIMDTADKMIGLIYDDSTSQWLELFRKDNNNTFITLNATTANITTLNVNNNIGVGLFGDYIRIANSSFDLSHDISTSSGVFYFDDGTGKAYLATIRKRIDASWAAGTGNGGLDTGSVAANETYHVFAIYNPTTKVSDMYFTADSGGTSGLPSGYTKKCRLGSIKTDGSANIVQFYQVGKRTFLLKDQVLDWDENPFSGGSQLKQLSIPSGEAATSIGALLEFTSTDTDNVSETVYGLVSSPLVDDNAASASNNNWFYSHLGGNYRNNSSGNGLEIVTDDSARVRIRFSGSGSSNYRIVTRGWVDYDLQNNR